MEVHHSPRRYTEGKEPRALHILRELAAAFPAGLSTPQLTERLNEGIEPHQRALAWYGAILRRYEDQRLVTRTGTVPGAWQRGPSIIWGITPEGLDYLAWRDAAPARKQSVREAAERSAAATEERSVRRAAALEQARARYSRATPIPERREVSVMLRQLGCSLQEIADVFGITREQSRLDTLPGRVVKRESRPPRRQAPRGARPRRALVQDGELVIAVGKQEIRLSRADARILAGIITDWEENGCRT